jgi:hypothetical protein
MSSTQAETILHYMQKTLKRLKLIDRCGYMWVEDYFSIGNSKYNKNERMPTEHIDALDALLLDLAVAAGTKMREFNDQQSYDNHITE